MTGNGLYKLFLVIGMAMAFFSPHWKAKISSTQKDWGWFELWIQLHDAPLLASFLWRVAVENNHRNEAVDV